MQTKSIIIPLSAPSLFINFSLAGVLKNKSVMINVVPSGQPVCSFLTSIPPRRRMRVPALVSAVLVISSQLVTAAMDASASPRKPKVSIASKSFTDEILLVA